ncbi:MAG: FRG domain-containing protein [Candidatus Acidiferrales bacterium]
MSETAVLPMEPRNLNTWEEFEKELSDIRAEYDQSHAKFSSSSSLLFRGHEKSCWLLSTTLDRKRERMLFKDYYRVIANIRPQIETLTDKEWSIPSYVEVENAVKEYDKFSGDLLFGRCPGYAYMAYLRHHGFPSPLLDWTRSPYIAAFFAFNKATEDSNSRVSIYVFGETSPVSGSDQPGLYRYGPYVSTHRRHVLQQSEYTLCARFSSEWFFEKYDTIFDPGRHQRGLCWKITLPTTERTKVLRMLDRYNLNAFSLFGSEDSMMDMLAVREFDF